MKSEKKVRTQLLIFIPLIIIFLSLIFFGYSFTQKKNLESEKIQISNKIDYQSAFKKKIKYKDKTTIKHIPSVYQTMSQTSKQVIAAEETLVNIDFGSNNGFKSGNKNSAEYINSEKTLKKYLNLSGTWNPIKTRWYQGANWHMKVYPTIANRDELGVIFVIYDAQNQPQGYVTGLFNNKTKKFCNLETYMTKSGLDSSAPKPGK